ncbi:TPA: ImmA/IrrE family metallo-endopeptidase, partial [Salmonella enterica subsp. enterica]
YRETLLILSEDLNDSEDSWLKYFPLKDMKASGWIPKTISKFQQYIYCLDYFNVKNLIEWQSKYQNQHAVVAFKKSQCFDSEQGAIDVWLRQGEILSEKISCQDWNKKEFITKLALIRNLTREKLPSIFIPKLQEICASCGVAVVIAKAPSGCKASGATKFITKQKAMIILSFRHLSDDHFWFSFFHEAAHLILHDNNLIFIDDEFSGFTDDLESEANSFAQRTLIPDEYEYEMKSMRLDIRTILRFSKKIGISSGIVVGQLQKMKIVPYNHFNDLKIRFKWS